jgi:predicted secreted Zn-dependent protease
MTFASFHIYLGVLFFALAAPAYATPVWTGSERCDSLFSTFPEQLPGGARLESHQQGEAHAYRLPEGGTLRILDADIQYFDILGATYAEAQSNLYRRTPEMLTERGGHPWGDDALLAMVVNRYHGEVNVTGSLLGYRGEPGSAELEIAPVLHLARWNDYAAADPVDQTLWDRAFCSHAHHELGHILVAAQIMTQAETDLTRVSDPTQAGISRAIRAALETMMEDIKSRQDLYHIEIDRIGRDVADSRPYVELPFSWLDPKG